MTSVPTPVGRHDAWGLAEQMGGTVRISVAGHRRYVESLRRADTLGRPEVRGAGVTRTVVGERVTYVTTYASEVDGQVVHACTITDLLVSWDQDQAPSEDLALHLRCDAVGREPEKEILSAVGLEPGMAKDFVSGLPVGEHGATYSPRSAQELRLHLDAWLSSGVPSLAVLVHPGGHSPTDALAAVQHAIPWSLRSAVSLIGIDPELIDQCDSLLVGHGLAPLLPGTVCVLRASANGMVDEHRSVLPVDRERHRLSRLAERIERALRQLARDLSRTLADPTLTGTARDPQSELETLADELATLRAATELAHEALARAGHRLRESQDRIQDLEGILAATPCDELKPAESGIVPRQADSPTDSMFETP